MRETKETESEGDRNEQYIQNGKRADARLPCLAKPHKFLTVYGSTLLALSCLQDTFDTSINQKDPKGNQDADTSGTVWHCRAWTLSLRHVAPVSFPIHSFTQYQDRHPLDSRVALKGNVQLFRGEQYPTHRPRLGFLEK